MVFKTHGQGWNNTKTKTKATENNTTHTTELSYIYELAANLKNDSRAPCRQEKPLLLTAIKQILRIFRVILGMR